MLERENENTENNALEETKKLEELSDLSNQIYELDETQEKEVEEDLNEEPSTDTYFTNPKKTKRKDKIKNWWKKRSKKQKIWIIIGLVLFVIAAAVGIFFLVKTLTKKEEPPKPVDVIVQEENYRYENGNLIFLNSNKEEIGRYSCENKNEELCFVAYYEEDDFDTEKKIYEDGTQVRTRSSIIENKYVFINDSSQLQTTNLKLYNMKDQSTDGSYKSVKKGDKNKFILQNENNLYGLVEIGENITSKLEFIYQYLGFTPNEKNAYISTQNNRNFIIDETGKNLSKAITGTIKNMNSSYVKVKLDNGKYEVYNYNNQNVLNDSFDYVELYNDFAVLINDTKMVLKFYDKTKLNENAIEINNKDYIKTSIYNENNTLKEIKECFAIEENNEILTITVFEQEGSKITMINKAEGILNKSLRNMNYFDGKLYIYSDIEKSNLLGTYTCANKNNIGSGVSSLTNCTLGTDTIFEDNDVEVPGPVGVIPIFNERFIFISDNPDLVSEDNKTIILYDLKKNTQLGKYNAVNTYSYTGTKDLTFSTVTDLQVIAKNQNGNFGVIKINLSDISGHIGFNYSSMERLKDCYVAKDANGYLLLSKANGSSLTSTMPAKIRGYNKDYVKVSNGSEYQIYDYEGNPISQTGYKYIELYDTYFAGVNASNQLGVFAYSKPSKNLINGEELVPLHSTKYYGNGTLAFKIENGILYLDNVKSEKSFQIPTANGE